MEPLESFYRYWGKARPDNQDGPLYHLLPYHCLDVGGVGSNGGLLIKIVELNSLE